MSKCLRAADTRLSASSAGAMAAAARPIGTFTHRTHSQPRPSVSTPPSSTPAAPPEPATAPQMPSARLRSAPSRKVVVTIDSAAGDRIAAPRPCTARAAISWPEFVARPPASDASANSTRPPMKTRRLPSRSAMRPPSSRKPPKVSTYAFTTHGRLLSLKCSARPIVGSATLTIDASRTTTNCATQSRIRAIQRRSVAASCPVMRRLLFSSGSLAYNRNLNSDSGYYRNPHSVCKEIVTAIESPERAQRADARRNRERVVEAARRCMARDGLNAGIEDIARTAGVGVGTVYRHFPNKDELVDALAEERFERLRDLANEALAMEDPWEAFETFVRASARIQTDDRALSEVLTSRPETMGRSAQKVGMLELVGE